MTKAADLASINCTQCGAGLSVLGGGRVRSHVCGYCGAVLDTQDNYRILDSIGKRNHPKSPAQIGSVVRVEGVPFTVIGTLGMVETWSGGRADWVEHQMFSPTHGYAWLSYEDGNFTLTRKVRDYDPNHWLSWHAVEAAEAPPTRTYRGQSYRYYETSTPQIDFMEGEFNWLPKLGKKPTGIVLQGKDTMLTLRAGETEKEVEVTRLLPRDAVLADLGVAAADVAPAQFHPLTPYTPMREEATLRNAFGFSALAALVLAMAFWMSPGDPVLNMAMARVSGLPDVATFEVTNTAQIAELTITTDFQNEWGVFRAEITGPDGSTVVAAERLVQFYSGGSGEDRWSEGSRNATLRFRPDTEGVHTLTLSYLEGEAGGMFGANAGATVVQGKPSGFWMWIVALVFIVGYTAVLARRAAHMKRRYAGSDWHED